MEDFVVRQVTPNDSQRVLELRNHPSVRRFSGNDEEIRLTEHILWFERKYFSGVNNYCFVLENMSRGIIGYCRLDFDGQRNGYRISLALDPNFRGQGLGHKFLSQTLRDFKLNKEIFAEIQKNNFTSIKLFKKNGFIITADDKKNYHLKFIKDDMPNKLKTIFIIITRSFITRNILRFGVLDLLKKHGYKVFVFFSADSIPQYLKEELEDSQVKLMAIKTDSNRLHRLFLKYTSNYLIFTKNTVKRALYFNSNAKTRFFSKKFLTRTKVLPYLRYIYLKIVSKSKILKLLYRYLDFIFFPQINPDIQFYFESYKPDLVFSTSFISRLDVAFMKEAKRRNVPTVSMPKTWDNIPLGYMQFLPDYFMVPNEPSRQVAVTKQDVPADKVSIVGIPQFDWYARTNIIKSRAEHFKTKGLDPDLPLIFFGSEGIWAPFDHEVADTIYEWIKNNELKKPCQLLVRPHFTNAEQDIFKNLRDKEKVAVDNYRITNFMVDKWDPNEKEIIDFVNTLYHCDIMINPASTLTLDAVCFDKPIINIGFGCVYEEGDKNGRDITTSACYTSDHFSWVMETKGTKKVDTCGALKEQIDRYLLNPQLESREREILRQKLCYYIDGKSSERIFDILDNIQKK